MSIKQVEAIARAGFSLISKNEIIKGSPFRYAFLSEQGDIQHFLHPLTLIKLALFIVDVYRVRCGVVAFPCCRVPDVFLFSLSVNIQDKKRKPFVCFALDEEAGRYVVAGVMCSSAHSSGGVTAK